MSNLEETRQRIRKSNVRIVVTYFVVFVYCTASVIFTAYLLWQAKYELALGIFNGLATLAAGIAGFWFGSRGTGFPQSETPGGQPGPSPSIFVGPELGTTRPMVKPASDIDDDALPPDNS
ncbi:MAG: hypothetical protein AAGA08_17680 [Pseudomonadota bacterium]